VADFITLGCPSCGGKLELTDDIDQFFCAHCGAEHLVRRGGGTIVLDPVEEGLKQIKTGIDRTASELAIVRLRRDIAALQTQKNNLQTDIRKSCLWSFIGLITGIVFCVLAFMLSGNLEQDRDIWLIICGFTLLIILPLLECFTDRLNRRTRIQSGIRPSII
jgi:hypothetical protein